MVEHEFWTEKDTNLLEVSNVFKNRNLSKIKRLTGGYTSNVFGANLDSEKVVIKQSRPREVFFPSYSVVEQTRMSTEIDVLNRLAPLFPQEVPVIKEYYPRESIAVMSDVSEDATLGFTSLMHGQAEVTQGYALGDFLARLKQATTEWEPFTTVENAHDQIAIRGLETEIANPEWGKKLRDYYLSRQNFLWVDGHPKNVFLSDSFPLVRAIDWDCSHFADPDYMLPNYFGQIPVFMTFGHIKHQDGLQFIEAMMKAYNNRESINQFTEEKMCFYAANQTIQRQDGKWLFDACGGVDEASLKRKAQLFYIGRKLLTQARTFDQYLEILDKEAQEFT